jgi:predicted Zn-dependent protease
LHAKTTVNAKKAASLARKQIAQLKRKQSTGEYDDEELKNAIEHAEKMERIAKKKEKHLKEEEKDNNDKKEEELIKKKHRTAENNELSNADMKYLKNRIENIKKENNNSEYGVTYGVGGIDIPVETVTPVEVNDIDVMV